MEIVKIESLQDGLTFTGDLFIDPKFLLLPHTAHLTQNVIEALKKWDFSEFNCEGSLSLGGDIGISNGNSDDESSEKVDISLNVKEALENSRKTFTGNSDKSRMEVVQKVYNEYTNYIELVFTRYVTHTEISLEALSETVRDLCVFIKDNRRYMLRINPSPAENGKNFIVNHAMRTTVLAIAIGLQLHLSISKLIELGEACIIHEIGMVRLPPQLYMTDRKLSNGERAQIFTHPVLGYEIAKNMNFPMSIQLAVLEHHEKENGTGYPRQLSGDKISSYAKIIAVACTFEAISSPRSYKEGRSQFDGILELLKNDGHPYDDQIIKALLYTVSLYPIGTFVYLKNGKCAMVMDVNPDNPRLPILQLLTEKDSEGEPKTVVSNTTNYAIARVLSQKEKEDVLKSIKIMEEKAALKNASNKVEQAPSANPEPNPEAQPQVQSAPVEKIEKPEEAPKPASTGTASEDGSEEIDISAFM